MRTRFWTILIAMLIPAGPAILQFRCAAQEAGDLLQGVRAAKDAHKLGEPVDVEYSIKNRGDTACTFHFRSSKEFDVWVTHAGKEVFRLSRGKVYAAMLHNLTLNPNQTKSYTARWDQKDLDGNQVGPGAYKVYAQLAADKDAPPPTATYVYLGRSKVALVPVTIKEAVSRSKELLGKRIMIEGVYRGWKPDMKDPNCKDGPPVTRGDWAVSDETGCIYVTGAVDLDPAKDVGTKITVVGKLSKTSKGQLYIE
ncbi:MAG: hypothetical protein A2Z18_09980, partial [Armatimonadetes bacterium RBG_16_58_9]